MTKIIIEESITSTIKTGVGQHTNMLNSLVPSIGLDYEIISNKLIERIKNATLKRVIYLIWLNTFFFFKLLLEKKGTIVLYTSFLPIIKLNKIKQIGVIHDLCIKIYPEQLSILNQINQKILNFIISKNADRILTVSDTVKKEVEKFYGIPENKIFTVYNSFSLNPDINNQTGLSKFGLNNEDMYIVSSSSLNPNKNIKCLIKAFELLSKKYPNCKLVLTGGKKHILNQYLNISNNKNIIFTGFVSSNDLVMLYKNSFCYAFPSIYEGFGIPIIDAQLLNVPVVCSDIPVFREVGKKSVLYSPLTPEGFSNNFEKLINNKSLSDELTKSGLENIKRFSKTEIIFQFKKLLDLKD